MQLILLEHEHERYVDFLELVEKIQEVCWDLELLYGIDVRIDYSKLKKSDDLWKDLKEILDSLKLLLCEVGKGD